MDWKKAFDGSGKAFIGGIVGAVATVLVTYATGLGGRMVNLYYASEAKGLFEHLDTTVYPGNRDDATHMSAKCLGTNEILVAGYCELEPHAPAAVLQNAGVYKDKKTYQCVYNNATIANANAICLHLTDGPAQTADRDRKADK
ncbi:MULTISPECIES: hypothetical protein [Paraburkholderia]|uniref:Uncharacterized protein n=1 Tax=Paraburkholderia madseniana TaxID=2599607 RepID=A0AAP5F033_9BURK|nr:MULTISPECIES: hypothetical protein [Paraburkholderia]MCX4151745.1 hypothetical protein [Paraburkholderia madseniana]MDN7154672.1 hypothetical protein [Paraburkholderia sp. WS6]MDQ6413555.1 hypothetical protein [Paraburkholderia madseniana]